jgi:hypothetical protein
VDAARWGSDRDTAYAVVKPATKATGSAYRRAVARVNTDINNLPERALVDQN